MIDVFFEYHFFVDSKKIAPLKSKVSWAGILFCPGPSVIDGIHQLPIKIITENYLSYFDKVFVFSWDEAKLRNSQTAVVHCRCLLEKAPSKIIMKQVVCFREISLIHPHVKHTTDTLLLLAS